MLAGQSRVAVLRGEAGVGKSALLGYLSTRVAGWCVARAAGVESETELAYAGLHQLCAPFLDHLGRLPGPQRADSDARALLLTSVPGLPGSQPVAGRIEQSYVRRLRLLPADTQLLVLTAAAEPLGDRLLLQRASRTLGIDLTAAAPAADAGLLDIGGRVEFAHPLVRSAAYRSAASSDRHLVHRALADATVAETDPDRRAWHRARATAEPDEDVAAELERSAGRAQARGGVAAAAAFLQRSADLTADQGRRAQRALAAARAGAQAGAFETAAGLLAMAEAGPLDERLGAQVDLLRGQIAFASGATSDAVPLLLRAARRFELIDLDLARETYLDACQAAQIAGHLARGVSLDEVCRAARSLPPPPHPPRPPDLLLDGLTRLVIDGPAAAGPVLRRATSAFAGADIPVAQRLRWGWLTPMAGASLWDFQGYRLVEGAVKLAREIGALDRLPMLLNQVADAAVWRGDLTAAASLIAEADAVCEATGARVPPFAALMLAAYRGREAEAVPLIQASVERATAAGQGAVVTWAHWAAMRLYNGLGRYPDALAAARQISETEPAHTRVRSLTELIEAAARTGDLDLARAAHRQLAQWTQVGGTSWGQGIEARCRALITGGQAAEPLYQTAIEHYRGTQLRPSLARARLVYGEWLRREGRRLDAREQLRTAHHLFEESGMEAYAERPRRELLATGEKARKRSTDEREELTPQEMQIVRLAADSHTNVEIAAQLFLSVRTVEWHLRKVFTKLGISSRRELRAALAQQAPTRSA